jgi:hypothetical protein
MNRDPAVMECYPAPLSTEESNRMIDRAEGHPLRRHVLYRLVLCLDPASCAFVCSGPLSAGNRPQVEPAQGEPA